MAKKLNRDDFFKYLDSNIGSPYLWGGQGETLGTMIQSYAKKLNQSEADTNTMIKFMEDSGLIKKDIKFYDCSGLVVDYLLKKKAIKYDTTAAGLYDMCDPIDKKDVVPGDWCFLRNSGKTIYHIGYVRDTNHVVHASGQAYGVIKEARSKRNWIYARPSFAFDFSDLETSTSDVIDIKKLKKDDEITTTKEYKIYTNAANAKSDKNSVGVYKPGKYYIFRVYGDAINITKTKGVAGAWIIP